MAGNQEIRTPRAAAKLIANLFLEVFIWMASVEIQASSFSVLALMT